MTKQKRSDKAVLLRIPVPMYEEVDVVAHEQNVTRSQFLRQSIDRNLHHYHKHEKPHFQQMYRQGMK